MESPNEKETQTTEKKDQVLNPKFGETFGNKKKYDVGFPWKGVQPREEASKASFQKLNWFG